MTRLRATPRIVRLIAVVATMIISIVPGKASAGMVTKSVLEVDLANPGDRVGKIVFYILGEDIGISKIIDSMTVHSPKPPDLFKPGFNQKGGPVEINYKLGDVDEVILSPLRAFKNNENIKFVMTIPKVKSVRVLGGEINNNGKKAGAAPAWYNLDGKAIKPGPKIPGFKVVPGDAAYTIYNDFPDETMGIQNLRFFPNITESAFDALDLDSVLAESRNSSLPNFILSPSTSATFSNLPDPDPGNLFIAVGQILDSSGNVVGSFADGVEVANVPEPSSGILLSLGLILFLLSACREQLWKNRCALLVGSNPTG